MGVVEVKHKPIRDKMPRKYHHESGLDYAERLARMGIVYRILPMKEKRKCRNR